MHKHDPQPAFQAELELRARRIANRLTLFLVGVVFVLSALIFWALS